MTQDEIVVALAEVESRSKSNTHRLDALEKDTAAINSLASSVAVMASKQERMREDITATATDIKAVRASVDELAKKPGKRWDAVVDKILLAIVGALVIWVLAKIGIG